MTRRRTTTPLTVAVVLASVLATACGGSPDVAAPDATAPEAATTTAPAAPPTGPATPATPEPTDGGGNLAALDFVAPDLRGGQVRGADHAGEDVVLWMWAPW